ncbi:EAL domain-containing protein [Paenibacillus sp. KS-LC4]|uniref:EAL domain-containing protein n=1 Tax=Paenibacillus sp. KS-LC4 TaxID=2979727 RepID=UPI0030D5A114
MKDRQTMRKIPESLGLKGERLAAFYQPILAMDTRTIIGYEVLGRACEGERVRSLGKFFGDVSISVEDHIAVDRILREQAMRKLGAENIESLLFINLKPNWIHRYGQSGELFTLQLIDKYGIDPRRIVIEITEESFNGPMDELRSIVDLYRSRGCLIAIDDVGSGFSSTDRIAHIQPNILKIDIHMIKKSATHNGYLGALRSFSALAEQIGASLLAEGVETRQDLVRAIEAGARYVQGFFFSKAEPEFQQADRFAGALEAELAEYVQQRLRSETTWQKEAAQLAALIDKGCICRQESELGRAEEFNGWITGLLEQLPLGCVRIYLCREDGIQLSANYCRVEAGEWERQEEYYGANWSWRPYFIPTIAQLSEMQRTLVSRAYVDLDTCEWIRTISILAGPGLILFADMKDYEQQTDREREDAACRTTTG